MIETNLNGKTPDIAEENIKKLKEIFPDVFTEEKVDFDKLQQTLGNYVEASKERYNFTWNGKSKALRLSQTPSTGTLRPCQEESKDWDTTQNLYIEGDNLEVLKLLQKSYHKSVQMIYIDPPYNTGNDILYKNDFSDSIEYYKKYTGQIDDDGFTMSTNSESNGKYHTNWLNMMYPRLRLARNLLSKDGIIIIAIDDYEQSRLKLICDEIYGEINFIGILVTRCNPQGRGKKNIDPVHEYHLLYAKDIESMNELKIKKRNFTNDSYGYFLRSGTNSRKNERPRRFYPMLVKDGNVTTIKKEEYDKIYTSNEGFNDDYINELTKEYEQKGYKVVFPIAKNGEEKVWQREFVRAEKECNLYIYMKMAKLKYH